MTALRRLIYIYIAAVAAAALPLVLKHKFAVLAGFALGAGIALMNFILLQYSVKRMVASASGPAQTGFAATAAKYFAASFLKLAVTAVLFFVFVVYVKVHLLGLLAGLLTGMLIYTVDLLRTKK